MKVENGFVRSRREKQPADAFLVYHPTRQTNSEKAAAVSFTLSESRTGSDGSHRKLNLVWKGMEMEESELEIGGQ